MSDVKPWKNRKSQAEIKQILSATNINTVESLKEKLAAIEHERWSDWQKWCHQVIRENVPFTDALESVLARWDKQIETPYDQLSDAEKASDMEQVDRYWPLIEEYIKLQQEALLSKVQETLLKEPSDDENYYDTVKSTINKLRLEL